jgi:hypothetical protein
MMVPQYYVVATGTVLFYDYLLTLADEVREVVLRASYDSLLKPCFEDQICVVWTKVVEYVSRCPNGSYVMLTCGSVLAFRYRELFPPAFGSFFFY